jgi:hypothetical protein
MTEVTDLLAALEKSLGAFSADPDRSLCRLAPVSHDERMNAFNDCSLLRVGLELEPAAQRMGQRQKDLGLQVLMAKA